LLAQALVCRLATFTFQSSEFGRKLYFICRSV